MTGIIPAMTERGLPHSDGATACPFVAFEDDRDERSDRPDHRHRCYAEVHPAPRAIAHQEAYCLSSAFAVCPTFQDWAQREAARARDAAAATGARDPEQNGARIGAGSAAREAAAEPAPTSERPTAHDAEPAAEWQGPRPSREDDSPLPLPPRRNPPRDWAAPPPWASGAGGAGAAGGAAAGVPPAGGGGAGAPRFLADRDSRGLAGSAADRLAAGEPIEARQPPNRPEPASSGVESWTPTPPDQRAQAGDEELAALVGRRRASELDDGEDEDTGRYRAKVDRGGRRPSVSSTRHESEEAPSWEHPRRFEAYPTIKSRPSVPGLPRLGIMAAALGIAALTLFFLPAVLGWFGENTGGGGAGTETPPPSNAVPSASPAPTVPPAPTPQIYIVKSGDTLSKIAAQFGISLDDLLEANRENIPNPDLIAIGDQVIIPPPVDSGFEDPGTGETSPAP